MAGLAPEVPRALAGRYRLVRLLARGGMAEVWEGRDRVLNRPVAVKMLLPHLAADPYLRERFKREAVTAARLVHPGIVAIFDAGVEVVGEPGASLSGGWPGDEPPGLGAEWVGQAATTFIVMELVPGETLRDLLRRERVLTPELALAIACQVVEALAHAHTHGLVHRDVKPANVLLRDEGAEMFRVKVADFGIAKAAAEAGDLTASGTLLGTPKYISPEQVQGHEPDARADLYSVGVVLFEMLAGRPPFQENSDMATALAHVQQVPPSLDEAQPGLPPGLGDLVGRLLEKDPAARFQSANELGAALASVRKRMGAPGPAGPAPYAQGLAESALGQPLAEPGGSAAGPGGDGPGHRPSPPAEAGRLPGRGREGPGKERGRTLSLPPGEGPVPSEARPHRRRRRPGRSASALVGTLVVIGAVVAFTLIRSPSPRRPAGGQAGHKALTTLPPPNTYHPIRILSVHELAQGGNHPDDNLGELKNLTSNDPATFWESAIYQGPRFGGWGGFGLVLHVASDGALHELVVKTPMQDWSAETFVGGSFTRTLQAWGRPTDQNSSLYGDATFSLGGKSGGWVLFWMLNPGPGYQAVVDKLSVR
ncbi:MAG: serine/threonine-protein kinase [Acidimicrobiales bacterium]